MVLIDLLNCIPPTSVCCETTFSQMKLIKPRGLTYTRSAQKTQTGSKKVTEHATIIVDEDSDSEPDTNTENTNTAEVITHSQEMDENDEIDFLNRFCDEEEDTFCDGFVKEDSNWIMIQEWAKMEAETD